MSSTSESEEVLSEAFRARLSNLGGGASLTFAGRMSGKVIGFGTQIYIASLLGGRFYGVYTLAITTFGLVHMVSQLGLQEGSVRYISKYLSEGREPQLRGVAIQSALIPFTVGCLTGSILYVGSDLISQLVFGEPALASAFRLLAVGIPLMATMMATANATRGFQDVKFFVGIKFFVHPLTNLLLVGVLYGLGYDLEGVLAAWVIAAGLGAVLSLSSLVYLTHNETTTSDWSVPWRPTLGYALPVLLVMLVQVLLLQLDTLMLGALSSDTSEVGIYQAAARTALLLTVVPLSLGTIFAPIVSDLHTQGDYDTLERLYTVTTKWTIYLSIPVVIVLFSEASSFLVLFGSEFVAGSTALLVLSMGHLVAGSVGQSDTILKMSGYEQIELINVIVILVINAVLNYALIPEYGSLGAATATATAIVLLNVLRFVEVVQLFGIVPFERRMWKSGVATAIAAAAGYLSSNALNFGPLLDIVLVATITGGLFLLTLLTLGLDTEDAAIVRFLGETLRSYSSRHD